MPDIYYLLPLSPQNGIQRNLTGSNRLTRSAKFVVFFSGRPCEQDGRPGIRLTETFWNSPPKPLIGIIWKLTGGKNTTSDTNLCFLGQSCSLVHFSTSHKPLNGIQRNLIDAKNLSSFTKFVSAFFQSPFVSDYPSVCYFDPRIAEQEVVAILKSWFVLSFGILGIFPRQEIGRESLKKSRCTIDWTVLTQQKRTRH